jgi:ABC-type transport system involved in cytochrome bd biosynthesis fused ATPase/permease subunit
MFYGSAEALAHSAYDWNRFFVEGGRVAELLHGLFGEAPQDALVVRSAFPSESVAKADRLEVRQLAVGHGVRPVASSIDLDLRRREMKALMGASGSGKSTFLEVLAGLRPAISGQVRLHAGASLLWDTASLSGAPRLPIGPCALVEQHPYIFEGSLRENLTFGNPSRLSDAVLWRGLERAGLSGFTRRYGGLEYFLKDRGRNLSEGERYRIALCRALLLCRPFLLLDEPFAALDEVSIRIVIETLEVARAETGVILVTHYLPPGLKADAIANFDDFRPTGMGPAAEKTIQQERRSL